MRSLFAPFVLALLSVGVCACGGSGSASHASSDATAKIVSGATPSQSHFPLDDDSDNDNPGKSRYDEDDSVVLDFGHAAGKAETQAITALVKRYYAAAAAGDGAAVCSLLYVLIAESVPEEYGQSPGASDPRSRTCAAVVSKLLEQRHRELVAEAAGLEVTDVRVEGSHGVVLLHFAPTPERRVLVIREHGAWKMKVLFDVGVP